jgi:hypothetical protein
MWFYGDYAATTAGLLITELDAAFTTAANPNWSTHDSAAGTNCKVYECQDDACNCHFFVKVDDNYTGYAIIELWEGWDAGTHAGTGASRTVFSSTYTLRIYRAVGPYFLSIRDHSIRYVNSSWGGTYIGRPLLINESQNVVMFAGDSTGATRYNNLCYWPNSSTGGWCFLFDNYGRQSLGACGDGASGLASQYCKGLDGSVYIRPASVISAFVPTQIIGWLDGVANVGPANASALFPCEKYKIDGQYWMVVPGASGDYISLVRMD